MLRTGVGAVASIVPGCSESDLGAIGWAPGVELRRDLGTGGGEHLDLEGGEIDVERQRASGVLCQPDDEADSRLAHHELRRIALGLPARRGVAVGKGVVGKGVVLLAIAGGVVGGHGRGEVGASGRHRCRWRHHRASSGGRLGRRISGVVRPDRRPEDEGDDHGDCDQQADHDE